MQTTQQTTHWISNDLPDIPLASIFKQFQDELFVNFPGNIPQTLDEVEFIKVNHRISSNHIDDSEIFRIRDSVAKTYHEIIYSQRYHVTIRTFSANGKLDEERHYYRLYPYSIEVGKWTVLSANGLTTIDKDSPFSFQQAMERVNKVRGYEEVDLYLAALTEKLTDEGVSVQAWTLNYQVHPKGTIFTIDSRTGEVLATEEYELNY